MLNRFFCTGALKVHLFFVVLLWGSVSCNSAYSQQCVAPYETITRFDTPEPGAAMVWQTFYNQYGTVAAGRQASFVSSYGLEGGDVLVAGQVQLMKNVKSSLILVLFDNRGRAKWEKIHSMPEMTEIVKIIADKEGSAVLVNMATEKGQEYFRIYYFDENGKLKTFNTVKDSELDLRANDIHLSIDGNGWVLPVSVTRKWGGDPAQSQRNAAVYILNKEGKKTGIRSYVLGAKTELLHVNSQEFIGEKMGYIATGYFENDSGKKIAWAMRLNPDLSLVWQKEYGRGLSAKLVTSVAVKGGDVLIAGDVNSAESNIQGAWLARLGGAHGEIMWQRYYANKSDEYNYNVRNVVSHEDGRISLLMAGETMKNEKRKTAEMFHDGDRKYFGHLLVLDPRGVALSGDVFFAGYSSHVSGMSFDSEGRCVLVGDSLQRSYAEIKRQRSENDPDVVPLSEEGEVHLPDVQLSEKTRQGLALLQKKITAQEVIEENHDKKESAKESSESPELLQKGWVFIPVVDKTYIDPCE